MDFIAIIEIIVAIVVLYFLIRFVVSPIIKAVIGVVIFILFVYLLQRFFGFDLGKVLAPFGISLDTGKWGSTFNWLLGPINYYVDQIKHFIHFLWGNVPKSLDK